MMSSLPPGSIVLFGALLLALLQGKWLKIVSVGLPIASFIHLLACHPDGHVVSSQLFDMQLTPIRVDKLSLVWGYVFHIAAILATIYGMHVRDRTHHLCAAAYVGSAIGAVFAGDLLTLFVYWEITAIASMFLVWADQSKKSFGAGMRYAIWHIGSGVLVLSGALLLFVERGTLNFGACDQIGMFHELSTWGAKLLLLGFGIKAAFPLLHAWLPDAYAKATPAGTVFLSAFTTKMAIYALARGYAGTELLITVGAIMCVFPLLHAILANDLRQTLAHVLNNQLGFMVVAVGVGTPLAISGAAAMAFAHVIYKGLLFMAVGAVLMRTGTANQTDLGGLFSKMRWTGIFCLVGAFSVAPLNCGFVTKSLVFSAVAHEHLEWVWLLLMFGAVGAFVAAGIKVPFFAFFGRPTSSREVEEAPTHMLVAMGFSAALCLAIGFFPQALYRILPTEVDYHPYSVSHIVQQLQLLGFAGLGFALLVQFGLYPRPVEGELLDVDWLYRKPTQYVREMISHRNTNQSEVSDTAVNKLTNQFVTWMYHQCSEAGQFGRSVSTNAMAISAMILLAIYLLVYY